MASSLSSRLTRSPSFEARDAKRKQPTAAEKPERSAAACGLTVRELKHELAALRMPFVKSATTFSTPLS
jgi:hypothetical protein